MNDVKSLSHSKWQCKYHIVFAPKYRRQIIYEQIKEDIGKILRSLCNRKQVELIERECCPDHIHILVAIPPHLSVSQFMGYVNVPPPTEARASCFNENSTTAPRNCCGLHSLHRRRFPCDPRYVMRYVRQIFA